MDSIRNRAGVRLTECTMKARDRTDYSLTGSQPSLVGEMAQDDDVFVKNDKLSENYPAFLPG